jgi:hypothetical protein
MFVQTYKNKVTHGMSYFEGRTYDQSSHEIKSPVTTIELGIVKKGLQITQINRAYHPS